MEKPTSLHLHNRSGIIHIKRSTWRCQIHEVGAFVISGLNRRFLKPVLLEPVIMRDSVIGAIPKKR